MCVLNHSKSEVKNKFFFKILTKVKDKYLKEKKVIVLLKNMRLPIKKKKRTNVREEQKHEAYS